MPSLFYVSETSSESFLCKKKYDCFFVIFEHIFFTTGLLRTDRIFAGSSFLIFHSRFLTKFSEIHDFDSLRASLCADRDCVSVTLAPPCPCRGRRPSLPAAARASQWLSMAANGCPCIIRPRRRHGKRLLRLRVRGSRHVKDWLSSRRSVCVQQGRICIRLAMKSVSALLLLLDRR